MVAVLTQALDYPCLSRFRWRPANLVIVLAPSSRNTMYFLRVLLYHHVSALLRILLASVRYRHVLRILHITGCLVQSHI